MPELLHHALPFSSSLRIPWESAFYRMRLMRHTLTLDFFLLENHRRRAEQWGFQKDAIVPTWTVISAMSTERREEVYCAVVPEAHCFTLEENILTGNCGGSCVRAGLREWVRLGYYFPDCYAAREAWGEQQRAKGGTRASRAFCAVQRQGKKYPITLAEIRERYFDADKREKLLGPLSLVPIQLREGIL